MAHQYIPKIFHDPHKNPLGPPPTYFMYGPLLDEIREVMAKHDELQKACKSSEAEYVASVTLAEREVNMSHIIKANALRRRCVEIESEVTKLDETELLLEEKKRKLK